MVKVLVNGGLFEISKVEEIVEKRVPFNGTNIRLVQIAKDSKQAVINILMTDIQEQLDGDVILYIQMEH